MTNIKPHLVQKQALGNIKRSKARGNKKNLIVMPSGIGKTYLSAFETKNFKGRVLYLVHRNEILQQAIQSFKLVHDLEDSDIGVHDQDFKDVEKQVVFATIQSISRKVNLEKIPREHFDYIIVDEYHHVAANSYKKILKRFRYKNLLGMTATPYRLDGKDIMKPVASNVPFKMDIKKGIESGFLCPFVYRGLWDDIDYSDLEFQGHKYKEKDLDKKLLIKKRNHQIIKEFKRLIRKRRTMGFCATVNHVGRCVKEFNKAGIKSIGITHKLGLHERRRIVEDFRSGRYQVLFTRDIFNEGVDFPEVEGLLFLRPTSSKTTFLQQLGRGLRTRPGKKDVLVLDFIGNYVNAYMRKDWIENVEPSLTGSRTEKPIFQYDSPAVHFDSKLIDLFRRQESLLHTEKNLINNYLKLKNELGQAPNARQIQVRGGFGIDAYISRWGSWLKFRTVMKDNTHNITREQILSQFRGFIKKHGRPPDVRDLRKYKMYSDNTVRKVFGSYGKCMQELGFSPRKHTKLDIDRKRIISDFKRVKKELGRVPFEREIQKRVPYNFSSACYAHFRISYTGFLKIIGEKPSKRIY